MFSKAVPIRRPIAGMKFGCVGIVERSQEVVPIFLLLLRPCRQSHDAFGHHGIGRVFSARSPLMTGAESTGRNPVTFPKRARECALGVVADGCRHLRQGCIRRVEALACQTEPQLAQEAERRKIALPAEDPNQGRARNMRFRRKLVQRPWMRGSSQHGGDGSGRRRRCEQPYYTAR
jgi:hypothetical protein